MMSNKALTLLLVFSLAFNIAFVGIWARNATQARRQADLGAGRAADRPAPMPRPDAFWASLELTPQQSQQVDQMRRELGQKYERLRADMQAQRDRLFALMEADPLDEQAVAECQGRIENAQKELRHLVMGQMIMTRRLLNPRQRHQWTNRIKGLDAGRRRQGWHTGRRASSPQNNRPETGDSRRAPGVPNAHGTETERQI